MNINATIIGQMIAFAIFIAFCMKYVWPPIMQALEGRKKKSLLPGREEAWGGPKRPEETARGRTPGITLVFFVF